MNQIKTDKLIVKFIENTISDKEIAVLTRWLEDDGNRAHFNEYVELNYVINSKIKFDYKSSLVELNKTIDKKTKVAKQRYLKYVVAAVIVVLISLPFLLDTNDPKTSEPTTEAPITTKSSIQIGTDKATLTLNDGTKVVLEHGEDYATTDATSNGKEIIYSAAKTDKSAIAYNYLTIPRGGQYYVLLSDSTRVWLNSESQLKYPVKFKKGESREVELVYGEAYFDVSPSTAHDNTKFIVSNAAQTIEVLGTEFNVNAYSDESEVMTTLVEGKVKVVVDDISQEVLLSPNKQLKLNKTTNQTSLFTVNTKDVTSWRRGVFSFKNMPLEKIMKTLSRWYDVDVVFEDNELKRMTFRGVLTKKQTLEQLMSIIKNENNFEFEIEEKTIRLK